MTREEYEEHFAQIEVLHRAGSYLICVRECGILFEVAFRQVLAALGRELEKGGSKATMPKAFKDFVAHPRPTLGVMVNCIRDDETQKLLRVMLKSNLTRFRRIPWKGITSIRNEAVHDSGKSTIDAEDAMLMKYWLQLFLRDTRLVGRTGGPVMVAVEIPGSCRNCQHVIDEEWRFCPMCGVSVHLSCISCGNAIEPTFKICPYCETPVRGMSHAGARAIHEYELLFKGAFLDSVLTMEEEEMLEAKRLELGLTPEEADDVRARCVPPEIREYQELVEAAYADGFVNPAERVLLDARRERLGINPAIASAIEQNVRRTAELANPV